MKYLIPLFAILLCPAALAAPFDKGNAAAGKALNAQHCAGCHAGLTQGAPDTLYSRANRRVKSASSLAQQITTCNANLGNSLFPEDELNLAAYLNSAFYKFK